jgi:hypothetical protein
MLEFSLGFPIIDWAGVRRAADHASPQKPDQHVCFKNVITRAQTGCA